MQLINFKGKVESIRPLRKVGRTEFPVQEVIILSQDEQWLIEFTGDNMTEQLAETVAVDDEIQVTCKLKCKAWQRDPTEEPRFFFSLAVVSLIPDPKSAGRQVEPAGQDITSMDDVPF
tara:strand:+ start:127 stop:480 length:354 start_codon:yes stop_codon:yes gene_type:complete